MFKNAKMFKLFKSKTAEDVSLLWTIISILVILGIFVPIISGYFSNIQKDYNPDELTEDVGGDIPESEAGAILFIIGMMGKIVLMFFWSFDIVWWIQLPILEPMRIIFYILIYRQIRSGGG